MTKRKAFFQPPDRSHSPPGSEWQRLLWLTGKRAQTITEHPIWSEITSEMLMPGTQIPNCWYALFEMTVKEHHQDAHKVERCPQVILPPTDRQEIWTNVATCLTGQGAPIQEQRERLSKQIYWKCVQRSGNILKHFQFHLPQLFFP